MFEVFTLQLGAPVDRSIVLSLHGSHGHPWKITHIRYSTDYLTDIHGSTDYPCGYLYGRWNVRSGVEYVGFTWQIAILAVEKIAVFAVGVFAPSIVDYDVIFDWTVVVQPCQKLGRFPVGRVAFPVTVRPENLRLVFLNLKAESF